MTMEQTVMTQANSLLSLLVPVIATLMITAIPGFISILSVIIHVTFWRRDNRTDGNLPYTHNQIRDKVYYWGRIYGAGSVVLLQGLVEMLLKQEFDWYTRAGLLIISLVATGPSARVTFDVLRRYSRLKSENNRGWAAVYKYITVDHLSGDDDENTPIGRKP